MTAASREAFWRDFVPRGARRGRSQSLPARRRACSSARRHDGLREILFHAPAAGDETFFPVLVLDSVMNPRGFPCRLPGSPRNAKRGCTSCQPNLPPPSGRAPAAPRSRSSLHDWRFTALEGSALESAKRRAATEIERSARHRRPRRRARNASSCADGVQNDSVTNVAHQLGYFETVTEPDYLGSLQRRIDGVTAEQVWDVARRRLAPACRTVGWFRPLESH